MKKTNEYWIEQAKLPAPDGYVCIGYGDRFDNLYKYYDSDEIHAQEANGMPSGLLGSLKDVLYYVKNETWEAKFGKHTLKTENNKTNMKKGIYTKQNEDAVIILKKMVADRGMKWYNSGNWILHNDYSAGVSQLFDSGDNHWCEQDGSESYKEVPFHEFIYELGKIPVKQKEIVINILPWTVTIRGDKVDIGCKKGILLSNLCKIVEDIPTYLGNYTHGNLFFYPGKNGVKVEGEVISWETWEKFAAELKNVK